MRKRLLFFASLAVILAIAVSGTYAWMSYSDTANNTMTFGSVEIELVSELRAHQSQSGEFVSKVDDIMPGDVFSDRVTVKNISENESVWVRLRLCPLWQDVSVSYDSEPYNSVEEFINAVYPAEYNFNVGEGPEQWTYKEGWWYYNSPISAQNEAEPLFTQVSFTENGLDYRYNGSNFSMKIQAQAVQFVNNGDQPGETWQDAVGWPESENN